MSRIDREVKRRSDGKILGTISIIRTDLKKLHDTNGQRLVNPLDVDSLIVCLTNPLGEQVFWQAFPWDTITRDET
jgi:hypothetical protein